MLFVGDELSLSNSTESTVKDCLSRIASTTTASMPLPTVARRTKHRNRHHHPVKTMNALTNSACVLRPSVLSRFVSSLSNSNMEQPSGETQPKSDNLKPEISPEAQKQQQEGGVPPAQPTGTLQDLDPNELLTKRNQVRCLVGFGVLQSVWRELRGASWRQQCSCHASSHLHIVTLNDLTRFCLRPLHSAMLLPWPACADPVGAGAAWRAPRPHVDAGCAVRGEEGTDLGQ